MPLQLLNYFMKKRLAIISACLLLVIVVGFALFEWNRLNHELSEQKLEVTAVTDELYRFEKGPDTANCNNSTLKLNVAAPLGWECEDLGDLGNGKSEMKLTKGDMVLTIGTFTQQEYNCEVMCEMFTMYTDAYTTLTAVWQGDKITYITGRSKIGNTFINITNPTGGSLNKSLELPWANEIGSILSRMSTY